MKRFFYVIHLDRNRILFLGLSFFSFTLFSFALGKHFGEAKKSSASDTAFFFPFANEDENTDTEEIEKKGTSKKEISTEETPKEGSIYLPDLVEMEPAPHVLKKKEPSKQRVRSPSKTALASRKKTKPVQKTSRQRQEQASSKKKKLSLAQKTSRQRQGQASSKKLRLSNTGLPAARGSKSSAPYYYLQIGAFRSHSAATRMSKGLKKLGFTPRIENKAKLHVVKVGKSPSLKKIKKMESQLRKSRYFPLRGSSKK